MSSITSMSTCGSDGGTRRLVVGIALMNSLVKLSQDRYGPGSAVACCVNLWPMACSRCVLPKPTPP